MTAEEHGKVALLVAIMQLLKCSPVENWDGTLIERDAGIIPLALENKEEKCHYQIRSDQISRSVVSDSLRPHESQHAWPPCPSPTPTEFTQTHVHRVGGAIQPSHPLSSPSPPAPNPSQHQSLFQ